LENPTLSNLWDSNPNNLNLAMGEEPFKRLGDDPLTSETQSQTQARMPSFGRKDGWHLSGFVSAPIEAFGLISISAHMEIEVLS